jgi:hypothetical protein
MKKIILRLTLIMTLLSLTNFVMADEWSKEQTLAWSGVNQSWQDEVCVRYYVVKV